MNAVLPGLVIFFMLEPWPVSIGWSVLAVGLTMLLNLWVERRYG